MDRVNHARGVPSSGWDSHFQDETKKARVIAACGARHREDSGENARVPLLADDLIDQINAANDIVDVVGSYVTLKRAGAVWKARCPFHEEKTPSFSVNPQRQMFKCFGCGAGGGSIRFVMMKEGLSFPEAARKLAEKAGIRIEEELMSEEDQARYSMRRRLLALHAEAADFFHQQLMKKPSAQIARDYLKSRGIGSDVAKSWKIGYAPDGWDVFCSFANQRGYSDEELIQSGLVYPPDEKWPGRGPSDRFRDRVMFPICDESHGEVIAFSGRVLSKDAKGGKYVNSPETPLFVKGAVLFGLHKSKDAIRSQKFAIMCEGQLDLITAFEAGVQNIIAPQGTAFTERQAGKVKRYTEEVVLCFDSDTAGQSAADKAALLLLTENVSLRVATMPKGEDPDSMIRGKGVEAFRERITAATEYFEFRIDREAAKPEFTTPRGRAAAARSLAEAVSCISDPVLRGTVLNRVAMRLEIASEDFARLLKSPKAAKTAPVEETTADRPIELEPTIRLLATVALRDEAGRAWLLEEPWTDVLEQEPDAELLAKILGADLHPDDPASLQRFLVTLSGPEEATVVSLLEDKPPANPLAIAHDSWRELDRRRIKRRLDSCKARLRQPEMDASEIVKLQKEVFDLQTHLTNLARLFSPPS
jgi:DNA primase